MRLGMNPTPSTPSYKMASEGSTFIRIRDQLRTLTERLTSAQSATVLGDLSLDSGQQVLAYTHHGQQGDNMLWAAAHSPLEPIAQAQLLAMHIEIHAAAASLRLAILDASQAGT